MFSPLQRDFLSVFGWNAFFEQQMDLEELGVLLPARITGEEKELYRLQLEPRNSHFGFVPGRFRHLSEGRTDFPAVGDWVLCRPSGDAQRFVIERILERKTVLVRPQVGGSSDVQIIASNIDQIFIVTSLNQDLNPRRLERYLTLSWQSGAQPILLLSKADLCRDVPAAMQELQTLFPDVPLLAVSAQDENSITRLREWLTPGSTSVLVGSSGVGKSTLLNCLLGDEVLLTQDIRGDDDKGRHTTTSRFLFPVPSGGLIIDTPGMRELGLFDAEEGFTRQFGDIEELMTQCRFGDCAHASEPGCAVKEALESGALPRERWQSYLKLLKEMQHAARKHDKGLQAQEKKKWKKLHTDMYERLKHRKRSDGR